MDTDQLLRIGELAERAGVATSAIRYYERQGLLHPDTRSSGQRRYTRASLRKLVFIGMLQDAGLRLDEVAAILRAGTVEEWKAIAKQRLAALDADIDRITRARSILAGALFCRFDHPLDECRIMGAEIDRRLTEPARPSPA